MKMKKSIISILSASIGILIGVVRTRKMMNIKVTNMEELSDKHLSLFLMMNQWVKIKQEGKTLSSYFEKKGYYKIAIYGMSYAGETLVEELKQSSIKVEYGIDKRSENIYADFKILSPEDILEDVDAIVVTSIKYFYEIEELLSEKVVCPILSLEDIVYEM